MSIYENFRNKKGFSAGSKYEDKRLINYHPPKYGKSEEHRTRTFIVNEGDIEYVAMKVDDDIAKTTWGLEATTVLEKLKLTAVPDDDNTPVNSVIDKGPIIAIISNNLVLSTYEIRRFVDAYGNEFNVDYLTWHEILEENLRGENSIKVFNEQVENGDKFQSIIINKKHFFVNETVVNIEPTLLVKSTNNELRKMQQKQPLSFFETTSIPIVSSWIWIPPMPLP